MPNSKARSGSDSSRQVTPIPASAFANPQLTLFQELFVNVDAERGSVSNAIDLWDSVPRYSISRLRMSAMRNADGFLPVASIPFSYRGRSLVARIHPAQVQDGDSWVSYYPSAREELVEHALRKIAAEAQAGFFEATGHRSGAKFSLHQLRAELKRQGHSMLYAEIQQSLEILSSCTIEIAGVTSGGDEGFARSTYLPALTGVRREDFDKDPTARWAVQFHPLVTQSIDRVTYRQFNYRRLMSCRTQLARWLLVQLVAKFTQAAPTEVFEMRFSTIRRDSAMLDGYKRDRDAYAAVDAAWRELQALRALAEVASSKVYGRRAKVVDIVYSVRPTAEFAAEQKAANRRQADGKGSRSALRGAGRG